MRAFIVRHSVHRQRRPRRLTRSRWRRFQSSRVDREGWKTGGFSNSRVGKGLRRRRDWRTRRSPHHSVLQLVRLSVCLSVSLGVYLPQDLDPDCGGVAAAHYGGLGTPRPACHRQRSEAVV